MTSDAPQTQHTQPSVLRDIVAGPVVRNSISLSLSLFLPGVVHDIDGFKQLLKISTFYRILCELFGELEALILMCLRLTFYFRIYLLLRGRYLDRPHNGFASQSVRSSVCLGSYLEKRLA